MSLLRASGQRTLNRSALLGEILGATLLCLNRCVLQKSSSQDGVACRLRSPRSLPRLDRRIHAAQSAVGVAVMRGIRRSYKASIRIMCEPGRKSGKGAISRLNTDQPALVPFARIRSRWVITCTRNEIQRGSDSTAQRVSSATSKVRPTGTGKKASNLRGATNSRPRHDFCRWLGRDDLSGGDKDRHRRSTGLALRCPSDSWQAGAFHSFPSPSSTLHRSNPHHHHQPRPPS